MEGVINHFLASVTADDRLGTGFADIDMNWLRALLNDWECETGGPCHTDEDRRVAGAGEGAGFTENAVGLVTHQFADAMFDAGVSAYEHFAAMRLFVDMLTMSAFGDG